ncbi:MAG: hemolysin III family protein [Desulfobacula sp.]|uniref:PAQR family membrane homeostasis protein TrhA n=1 Tax=Desulfobacula sp. TaxID=2593537 RepID=UPI0025BF2E33|nr:hemolysin III family protein [Desulfobacula sp.]MCD4721714.1 hemolysin III family protein [Desulfobacula sp.]
MGTRIQESFNFYSHLAGGIAAIIGTIYLIKIASYSTSMLITALIYGFSIIFLFSASSLYHVFKEEDNELSFWRKMDRLAIFFMIAGTYTPICYFCMEGSWRWAMIAVQWGLVGFGVISQLFFPRAPRTLYAVIYTSMGWAAIFPIKQVLANMSVLQEVLLFTGGVAFTIGGLIYAIKRPRLAPGIFSFHELFHVMVLIGGVFHYALIYRIYSEIII